MEWFILWKEIRAIQLIQTEMWSHSTVIPLAAALSMDMEHLFIRKGRKKTRGYSSGSFALHSPFTVASTTDSSLSFNLSSCASKRLRTELFCDDC